MTRHVAAGCLLGAALVVFGCEQDQMTVPDRTGDTGKQMRDLGIPPQFYTLHEGPEGVFTELELIDAVTGQGTYVTTLDIAFDDPRGFPIPLGVAFDVDGTMYAIVNWIFGPEPASALAVVDRETGGVTYVGGDLPLHYSGPDMDSCGDLYAMGFETGPPGEDPWTVGDTFLYRFDKHTGEAVPVGDTGIDAVMDLAFDSGDQLYATTDNKLYLIDISDGSSSLVAEITEVPDADLGMEVMSIAFDEKNILYAAAMIPFQSVPGNSPAMRIDVATGVATLLGYTNLPHCHGGDILPTKVTVCHRRGFGDFTRIRISLADLQDHLDHGDIVPGLDGSGCECP